MGKVRIRDMRQVLGTDYDQTLLLAPTVEQWIGPRHPVRFIREFVGTLDLKGPELDTLDREQGGVAYELELLLQVWVYGYYRENSQHARSRLSARIIWGLCG